MSENTVKMRPNIRIEIQNNIAESMEVDEGASEGEEGEILDKTDMEESLTVDVTEAEAKPKPNVNIWADFDRGILNNTFKSEDDSHLTKTQIEALYTSLGVNDHQNDIRFEAIHFHGTGDLTTLDLLKYFIDYSPTAIEWVDEKACNIVWQNNKLALKALCGLSKPIAGMPVVGLSESGVDEEEVETPNGNCMKNKHRDIEMRDDEDNDTDKENSSKEVSVCDVPVTIPPGYWRLGNASDKSKCILLRYALKSDKKPFRAENFTEYYKQCGVVETGGVKGLISESRKRRFQGIFDRNRAISGTHVEDDPNAPPKNPWGSLAENWYHDIIHAEPEYKANANLTAAPLRGILVEAPPELQHRLGFKRAHVSSEDEDQEIIELAEIEEDGEIGDIKEVTREREKITKKHKKKSKVPRMRMYADDEEEKLKRKRVLNITKVSAKIKKEPISSSTPQNDLRSMLARRTNPNLASLNTPTIQIRPNVRVKIENNHQDDDSGEKEEEEEEPEEDFSEYDLIEAAHLERDEALRNIDLGGRLKNRNKKEITERLQMASGVVNRREMGENIVSRTQSLSRHHPSSIHMRLKSDDIPPSPSSAALSLHHSHHHSSHRARSPLSSNSSRRRHHHNYEEEDRHHQVQDGLEKGRRQGTDDGRRYGGMHADRDNRDRYGSGGRRGGGLGGYREEQREEDENRGKTKSKVMVVVKKHPRPTVASTVIPRTTHHHHHHHLTERERLKTVSEGKLRVRRDSSTSSNSSSSSNSSDSASNSSTSHSGSSNSGSSSSEESDDDNDDGDEAKKGKGKLVSNTTTTLSSRPSFNKSDVKARIGERGFDALRIKIKNDEFRSVK